MLVDWIDYYEAGREMELQCRLFELWGVVDRHIVVCPEGMDPTTLHRYRHTGPLDAISADSAKEVWEVFEPNTAFVIGEVTSIPRRSIVDEFPFTKPAVLKAPRLFYSVKYQQERHVFSSLIGLKKHFNKGPGVSLEKRRSYEAIDNGGWVLEWFGGEVHLQELLMGHPIPEVRMARKKIAEQYPRLHLGIDNELLIPYTGDTPDWHARGHAPNSWDLEW